MPRASLPRSPRCCCRGRRPLLHLAAAGRRERGHRRVRQRLPADRGDVRARRRGDRGSVGKITVNDQGNAEVALELDNSIEPPTADATAAIRQQDTTGDSYVAYDPGNAKQPLGPDGIVCKSYDQCDHTLVAPRLDDLLNSFGSNQRAGIKLILDETAKALDRRGADLNAAALQLKPAVAQADIALQQVNSQNDALKQLLSSSENVTGQLASRNKRLGDLIGSLSATLNTVSQQTGPLDKSLAKLPETASRARTTLAALTRTAQTAQPLAEQTADSAPLLASALRRFPDFLDNASSFLTDTRSTLVLTKHVLKAAQPTLEIGKKNVVTGSFDLIGATADLLNSVLGGKDAFPALFGDDSYGHGQGTLGKRGFGSVAVEPGDLPPYPSSWKPRNWLRVSAVINCEVFGVPVKPGCLTEALSSLRAKQRARTRATTRSGPTPSRTRRRRYAARTRSPPVPSRAAAVTTGAGAAARPAAAISRAAGVRTAATSPTFRISARTPRRASARLARRSASSARTRRRGSAESARASAEGSRTSAGRGPRRRARPQGPRQAQGPEGLRLRLGAVLSRPHELPARLMARTRRSRLNQRVSSAASRLDDHKILLGVLVGLVGAFLAYVAFISTTGPPFESRYQIKVEVPGDAPPLRVGQAVRVAASSPA